MKVEVLNIETEKQLLSRLDKMSHICHSDNYEDREFEKQLRLYKHLINKEHLASVEHIYFYLTIEGITRSCANQLVRHRIASYSQQSLTYVSKDKIEFILPERLTDNKLINNSLNEIKKLYENLLKEGISKVDARFILPLCTGTKISMTLNLRSLINFLKLRKFEYVKSEIRILAFVILDELYKKYPTIIGEIKNKYKI